MMDKRQTYDYLDAHGVSYEATERAAVYSMAKLETVELPYPDCDAKNLSVRDGKKRAYCLITLMGDGRVDLKEFRRRYGTRPLSYASADDLGSIMGLESGSVTPLGLLNDEGQEATVFLDADLASGIIGVHPQRQHRHRLDAGGGSCARCREPWQRGARRLAHVGCNLFSLDPNASEAVSYLVSQGVLHLASF